MMPSIIDETGKTFKIAIVLKDGKRFVGGENDIYVSNQIALVLNALSKPNAEIEISGIKFKGEEIEKFEVLF